MKKSCVIVIAVLLTCLLVTEATGVSYAASAYDAGDQKLAALTFDDGPGPYSDWIMDTLESRGAKATFFMNGYLIAKYPDAVRRMVADGFQVGNHTFHHIYLTKNSAATAATEISSVSDQLMQLTGLSGTGNTGFYLRPPYGAFNSTVVANAGVPVIWCTVDSGDWKYDDSARLVSYTGSAVQDGDIVIMHESHKTTAQGLGALVDRLQQRGFQLVTVQELFYRRGITPQAGQIYYSAKNNGINLCDSSLYFDESRLNTHWAWNAIQYVTANKLMDYNEYGEFTPNFPLTRAMFVTMLGRMADIKTTGTESGFTDVAAGSFAAPYCLWASQNGIMKGSGDGSFGADKPVTRQEMASALYQYELWRGNASFSDNGTVYSDADSIATWARTGVSYCTANGILSGEGGAFKPAGNVTRAMGAVVMQRLSTIPQTTETTESTDSTSSSGRLTEKIELFISMLTGWVKSAILIN